MFESTVATNARAGFAAGRSFFFTLVTAQRAPLFADPAAVQRLRTALARVRLDRPFSIDAMVVLPDHVHALWTLPADDLDHAGRWRRVRADLARWVRLGRRPTAWQRPQPVWQRGSWHFAVADAAEFVRSCDYIHYDPVHHGLCASPCEWPASSFRRHVKRGYYSANWAADGAPPGLATLLCENAADFRL